MSFLFEMAKPFTLKIDVSSPIRTRMFSYEERLPKEPRADFRTSLQTTLNVLAYPTAKIMSRREGLEPLVYSSIRNCLDALRAELCPQYRDKYRELIDYIGTLPNKPNEINPVYGKPNFRVSPDEIYYRLKAFAHWHPQIVLEEFSKCMEKDTRSIHWRGV